MDIVFLNAMANSAKTVFTHVGLRNGATELTGGSPAYARQALSYGATANGDWAGTATFNVPPSSTVNTVAFYTASTGGSSVDAYSVTSEVFASQGTYDLTVNLDVD